MNLNFLLSPKFYVGLTIFFLLLLINGVFNFVTGIGFLLSAVISYFLIFPAKNNVYEKDNVFFPFTAYKAKNYPIEQSEKRTKTKYKIPIWKLRTSISFPTYSELTKLDKTEDEGLTTYKLNFNSSLGKIKVEAVGHFFADFPMAMVGDFGLGNKKALILWGTGDLYLTLPRPIADSFAIKDYDKIIKGMKINSF